VEGGGVAPFLRERGSGAPCVAVNPAKAPAGIQSLAAGAVLDRAKGRRAGPCVSGRTRTGLDSAAC